MRIRIASRIEHCDDNLLLCKVGRRYILIVRIGPHCDIAVCPALCLLYPRQRTSAGWADTSVKCRQQTWLLQSKPRLISHRNAQIPRRCRHGGALAAAMLASPPARSPFFYLTMPRPTPEALRTPPFGFPLPQAEC